MPASEDLSRLPSFRSNVDEVVSDLAFRTISLDGGGLVDVFQVLLARAEEIKAILTHSDRTSKAMLDGEAPLTQEGVNSQMLDVLGEVPCLKYFLACACKKLSDDLGAEVYHKLDRFSEVAYNSDGEVERMKLAEP
jgi:hypothetical protein